MYDQIPISRSFPPPSFGSVSGTFWLLLGCCPPWVYIGPDIGPTTSTVVPQLLEIYIQQRSLKGISRFGWMMPHQGMPQIVKIWRYLRLENFHYQNDRTTLICIDFKQRNVKVHKHRTFTTCPPSLYSTYMYQLAKLERAPHFAMRYAAMSSCFMECYSINPQPNIFHHITLSCCHSHPGPHCPPNTKTFFPFMWNLIILFRSVLESNLRPLTLTSAPNCSFFALRGGGSNPKSSSSSGPSNRTRRRFFLIFSSFAGSSKYFFTISPVRFASSSSIKIARCCQSMKQELGRWYAVATITWD